ncbi:VOC family protein [Pontibacter sp. SGAir0037]|uniref:VOC family protein n=1 Tax=Pontibacter sp. SGAir0037 TaxID=2571030 RepID=UPI0010CCB79B|nr:VOC family protein [Pontibacter sp. SGAir0037]QCR22726.1 glyoxalase [Pontibacter sp. SGAir0037]
MKTKYLLTAFILLFFSFSFAQAQSAARPAIRLNHIAIYVQNLEKSTSFYKNVLQLEEIPEPFHDGLHTWFSMGAAGQLHLIKGANGTVERNKNDHLCFSVASIDDFIANLQNHKVKFTDWPGTAQKPTVRVDGVKQIYFQDPDGHWIEINNDFR